jgi:hypothetical protein
MDLHNGHGQTIGSPMSRTRSKVPLGDSQISHLGGFNSTEFKPTASDCMILHDIALHDIELHNTELHETTLHCIALHSIE